MKDRQFDVIVVGLGAMGSSALHHLAARGQRALGLEQFQVGHGMGSSHGVNRIIRLAYMEHPSYVPLLRRSYELWRRLEADSGERILVVTGGIDAGPPGDRVFEGSLESCLQHDLEHEVLTGPEVNARFPGYRLPSAHRAVFQPDAGYVMSETAIAANVRLAEEAGAEVRTGEPVTGWEPTGDGVVVRTRFGKYRADRLVVTAGAWSPGLLDPIEALAVPERQVLAWFQTLAPERFQPETFPIFIVSVDEGMFYGFPIETVPGFKVGLYHHLREVVDPDTMDREAHPEDEAPLRSFTAKYFPEAAGPTITLKTCLFTNTPDEHFIVDVHPELDQVSFAAGFSGHGFKFSSVVGEILADLSMEGSTHHDISLLRYGRFAGAGSSP